MPIHALNERRPEIADDAWIADTATIIGSVVIGRGASIWFNCVLRADNDLIVIGDNTTIQDGSVLHTDEGIQLPIFPFARARTLVEEDSLTNSWPIPEAHCQW